MFFVPGTTRHPQLLGLSLQDFQKLPQTVGTENYSTTMLNIVCENVSRTPTGLFCRFCWNESTFTTFPVTTTQIFSQSLFSRTLCRCVEIFSTTNKICIFWHRKFQQVCTHAFYSGEDVFRQKGNCGSPNNLRKCTESRCALSTNTFLGWNLYLS